MTETSPMVLALTPESAVTKFGAAGQPAMHTQVRLVDENGVDPAEVESVLYQLPEIAEVSVIGVPDDTWVEVGRACVVLKEGRELTEQAIIAHCRANLARFKVPQSVIFLDEIPHNATGKVLKRELGRLHGGG